MRKQWRRRQLWATGKSDKSQRSWVKILKKKNARQIFSLVPTLAWRVTRLAYNLVLRCIFSKNERSWVEFLSTVSNLIVRIHSCTNRFYHGSIFADVFVTLQLKTFTKERGSEKGLRLIMSSSMKIVYRRFSKLERGRGIIFSEWLFSLWHFDCFFFANWKRASPFFEFHRFFLRCLTSVSFIHLFEQQHKMTMTIFKIQNFKVKLFLKEDNMYSSTK